MDSKLLNIILADNNSEDCNFFKKTVKGLTSSAKIDVVHNGEQLMKYLSVNLNNLPDILFLDMNMPRKNGFECLSEINKNVVMRQIFVVIYSITFPRDPYYQRKMSSMLRNSGASLFIHKSGDFDKLRLDIYQALCMVTDSAFLKEPVKNMQIKQTNL